MEMVLWGLLALVIGAGLTMLIYRPLLKRAQQAEQEAQRALSEKQEQLLEQSRQLSERATREAVLEEKLAVSEEKLAAQQKQLAQQKEEAETLQQRQILAFKNLATEILEEKSAQFKQANQESLNALLRPFRENIDGFRKKVEEVYVQEAQQRFSLKEEIHRLSEMNRRMSEEANNLTAALKGNSKTQGDWGEMILETILDSSHLVKGIHYLTQENLKDENGANLRPDVILNLPEGKQVIIDSKVSLTAYVAYTESEKPEDIDRAIKNHLRSVRAHVEELARKSYQNQVDSPDFVIMFIPNEPAFLLALQQDPSLWSDAYNKKVIISSPTNLFALLKIVYDLWKRADQSKNAQAIAEEGAKLYDKFIGFADTLLDLGKSLKGASEKYDKAMNQLKTGSGNLVRRTERLRELGVRAMKKLPQQLADYEGNES